MTCRLSAALLLAALIGACAGGRPEPAAPVLGRDTCAHCRMTVSSLRFAAQLVAPGEEPRFFDDIGCLRGFLDDAPDLPADAVAFVADHRSGAWVRARDAVFTRVEAMDTPMGSHLLAHASAAARDADPDARGGAAVDVTDLFGPSGPPGGAR
jgi:copper chaperone NosL